MPFKANTIYLKYNHLWFFPKAIAPPYTSRVHRVCWIATCPLEMSYLLLSAKCSGRPGCEPPLSWVGVPLLTFSPESLQVSTRWKIESPGDLALFLGFGMDFESLGAPTHTFRSCPRSLFSITGYCIAPLHGFRLFTVWTSGVQVKLLDSVEAEVCFVFFFCHFKDVIDKMVYYLLHPAWHTPLVEVNQANISLVAFDKLSAGAKLIVLHTVVGLNQTHISHLKL